MKEIINNQRGDGGLGFFGVLALILITLKLLGLIEWSWLWVTAPLWGGFVIGLFLVVIVIYLID